MLLTRTNWLVALRDDILERQTLYPDGGDVGRLTKSNWLVKLKKDVLARQTLYPSSENIGQLHGTNWLIKMREEILETQSLFPEGGKAALSRAITRAQNLLNNTIISDDGEDVQSNTWWAPQSAHTTLSTAINTAQEVLDLAIDDEDPTLEQAVDILNSAIAEFNLVRQPGKLQPIVAGWTLSYAQPSQVTMNRLIIPLSAWDGYQSGMLADMNTFDTGVYNSDWTISGNVKLWFRYVADTEWFEGPLDFQDTSLRPFNRITMWEWETPNVRITGDNSTGQPIQLRLILGGELPS